MADYQNYRPDVWVRAIDPVKVIVKGTVIYYAEKASPFAGAFFGSLLTLPGIFAFKESRERKRKERLRIEIASELPSRNRKG